MRYIGTCIGFPWSAVPITDTVKMSISVADISADPIIGTPLNFIFSLLFSAGNSLRSTLNWNARVHRRAHASSGTRYNNFHSRVSRESNSCMCWNSKHERRLHDSCIYACVIVPSRVFLRHCSCVSMHALTHRVIWKTCRVVQFSHACTSQV